MKYINRKYASSGEAEKSNKTHIYSVRLDEEQDQTLKFRLQKSGRKLSDYLRHALLKSEVTPVATPEDMALLRAIGSMANNLNQLAKRAHQEGFRVVKWDLDSLVSKIKSLYNQLSDDWKNK